MGYESDIAAHGIGGAVETDSIEEAIAGDPNFAKITGPANLKNRYYSEDIPFGIATWAKLARLIGVPTPVMDSLVSLGGVLLESDCWLARLIGVPTPVMDSLVSLGGVLLESDCWEGGRSMAELGIDGMDREGLRAYLIEG